MTLGGPVPALRSGQVDHSCVELCPDTISEFKVPGLRSTNSKITAAVPASLVDSESDPFSLCMRKTGKRYSSRTQVKGSVW